MEKYANREEAGKILAARLNAYANRDDVLVLALPRGGVPVAFEIASALKLPLDVFIVRKLGAPHHKELAMGAIAMGGVAVLNDEIIRDLHITKDAIHAVKISELQELKRREQVYRDNRPYPSLENKTIILVDDGIATGATMRAAIMALRKLNPTAIIVAVPVADKTLCDELEPLTDGLICPLRPLHFHAVGAWYDDFQQTEDEEVHKLLKESKF